MRLAIFRRQTAKIDDSTIKRGNRFSDSPMTYRLKVVGHSFPLARSQCLLRLSLERPVLLSSSAMDSRGLSASVGPVGETEERASAAFSRGRRCRRAVTRTHGSGERVRSKVFTTFSSKAHQHRKTHHKNYTTKQSKFRLSVEERITELSRVSDRISAFLYNLRNKFFRAWPARF